MFVSIYSAHTIKHENSNTVLVKEEQENKVNLKQQCDITEGSIITLSDATIIPITVSLDSNLSASVVSIT